MLAVALALALTVLAFVGAAVAVISSRDADFRHVPHPVLNLGTISAGLGRMRHFDHHTMIHVRGHGTAVYCKAMVAACRLGDNDEANLEEHWKGLDLRLRDGVERFANLSTKLEADKMGRTILGCNVSQWIGECRRGKQGHRRLDRDLEISSRLQQDLAPRLVDFVLAVVALDVHLSTLMNNTSDLITTIWLRYINAVPASSSSISSVQMAVKRRIVAFYARASLNPDSSWLTRLGAVTHPIYHFCRKTLRLSPSATPEEVLQTSVHALVEHLLADEHTTHYTRLLQALAHDSREATKQLQSNMAFVYQSAPLDPLHLAAQRIVDQAVNIFPPAALFVDSASSSDSFSTSPHTTETWISEVHHIIHAGILDKLNQTASAIQSTMEQGETIGIPPLEQLARLEADVRSLIDEKEAKESSSPSSSP